MAISANDIVSIQPGVLSAGGNALALNGLLLTKSELVPTGSVKSFGSADSVGAFFGTASTEYAFAQTYFSGFENSAIKPTTLLIAPYVGAARAAWLKSGSLSSLTLTQLQALTGTLIVTVDGTAFTSSSISLATATSFSDAATKITAGFTGTGKPTCTWNALDSTFQLTSSTTGATSTIDYATGTLSTSLKFTAATAAVKSQGAAVDTIDTCMTMINGITQNWFSFTTTWEPDAAGKTLIAAWSTAQNSRYAYVVYDIDGQAIVDGSTTNFGVIAKTAKYDGVYPIYGEIVYAAFQMGCAASIDFSRTNGRITFAFKSLSGLAAKVTTKAIADILIANGYNFYGNYATANDNFSFMYPGQVPGKWLWFDELANEVYLNSQMQLALMTLLTNIGSVPYNQQGYSLIRAALADPITSAVNFGAIRKGVVLSAQQKAIINANLGLDVSGDLFSNGYYLQILDPTSQARAARQTPVITFYYVSGGAIHKISFPSVDVL